MSSDICARYFGSDGTLCSTHHAPFDSPSESRCSAARLSHDRGADALREAVDALVRDLVSVENRPLAVPIVERHLPRIVAALSVPAPTLPALDVDVLYRAMQILVLNNQSTPERRHAEAVARAYETLREALRDAV
jgi:hypothetical protein